MKNLTAMNEVRQIYLHASTVFGPINKAFSTGMDGVEVRWPGCKGSGCGEQALEVTLAMEDE